MTGIPKLPVFEVEWKGQSLGGFTLVELRQRLGSGQLSRMHRVKVDGAWLSLGTWLDQMEAHSQQASAAAQAQAQRDRDAERERTAILDQRSQLQEERLRHAVPPPPPPFVQSPAVAPSVQHSPHPELNLPYTSGMAVAALVFGILAALLLGTIFVLASEKNPRWIGVVLWCDMVAWLLSIIFGHLALVDIRHEELARGQGLAMTGLTLGYSVVALITVRLIQATLSDDYRHLLN